MAIGATDHPSDRSVSHRLNIPLMGGLAVALGFAVGLAVASKQLKLSVPLDHLIALGGGGALVLFAGVYDDRFGMNAWVKFSVQVLAAVVAIASGFQIDHFTEPFSGQTFVLPTALSWLITGLWIVTVTNAINLIDGLDGLATGIGAIIAGTLALIAFQTGGNPLGVCLGVVMLGALLGFLPFNFPPARVFLGDTGALFIGFELSLLALVGYRQLTLLTFVVPVLVLAVPILDTTLSVIRRLRSRSRIFNADRQHMHHRMLESEGTQRRAVLQVYLLTGAFCLIALAFSQLKGYTAIAFLLVVGVLTMRLVRNLGALSSEATHFSGSDEDAPEAGKEES
jgi:UDP-GlcNAc:undecaprenyl-phosphate GlcNAc-1-phosphate transferase